MQKADREIDKTHLSIDMAEERMLIHRDYIAHALRWSHVAKWLHLKSRYKTARILDVGCGKEMPLGKLLYTNKMSGAAYTGIDVNRLDLPEMLCKARDNGKLEVHVLGQCDASTIGPLELPYSPNVVVCFEVLEHVHPRIARRLVQNLHKLMADGGTAFFSTPVFNGSAAANHINEMSANTVGSLLETAGFTVENYFGTFASIRDYSQQVKDLNLEDIFARLREYYDTNLLAVMFAPIFPHQSRNILWRAVKQPRNEPCQFPELDATIQKTANQHLDIGELIND